MPYLGNAPTANFASVTKDTFSGNGSTTSFTLSKAATTNGVAVFVENVRQEPTTAYAVSGTTLTFTAAPVSASGNNIYVLHHNSPASTATHPATQALTATSGTFTGNVAVDTDTLFADATNDKVGINNASPNHELQINGNSTTSSLSLKTSATGNTTSDGLELKVQGDSAAYLYNYENAMLRFGTNGLERMRIDADGHVTMQSQSAFNVGGIDGPQNNVASDGTLVTVKYDSERFDQNSDYNTSTYTFTAPVTGKYYLHAQVYVNSVDSAATYYSLRIDTSNKDYISIYNYTHSDINYITFQIDVLADMDANDTATVGFLQPDGTSQTDIQDNASYTFFCGHLVC